MERTKVFDTIYIKYGTKMNYLQHAYEFHELQNDEDIKTLEASFTMQAEQKKQEQEAQIKKMMELGEDEQNLVKEELKDISAELNNSGLLPLDTYIKI